MFAAGGTGGHLFPAMAIAEEIKRLRTDALMVFVGTKGKIEARLVPAAGYEFRTVWISGFHRRLTIDNLLFPLKVIVALVQSFFVIRQARPDVVVGTGGYVCGPILSIAALQRIPTVIHESNSYPGITTRLLAPYVTRIFTAFEATGRWLRRSVSPEVVGTPTRPMLTNTSRVNGAAYFGLDPKRPTLLVFGGSLGATSINQAMLGLVAQLKKNGIQWIWQTGERDFPGMREKVTEMRGRWMGAFIDRMDLAFVAADLTVCRAGATTLAELTRLGMPAILVPYPHAAADHQTFNARTMVEAGAALMVTDKVVQEQLSESVLHLMADQPQRLKMAAAARNIGHPKAGAKMAREILALAVR
jgi:UDP-N-acetylglucosamine--N-acetylmuramyl-(pentapeptide) pyrophosphoryl-undecaprenol N-acetylglucosamine transferase